MIRSKDGYGKHYGTAAGSANHALISDGSILEKNINSVANTLVQRNAQGQIVSTLATGKAPFVVASTDLVANLNANYLDGITKTELLNKFNDYLSTSGGTINGQLIINKNSTSPRQDTACISIQSTYKETSYHRPISYINTAMSVGAEPNIYIGYNDSTYNGGYLGFKYVEKDSSSNYMSIGLYNSDNLLCVLGNGNVGIGTANPTYKLDVNGTLGVSGNLKVNGYVNITDNYKIGGLDVVRVRTDHLALGEETTVYSSLPTKIYGKYITMQYGENRTGGFYLNSSGNVTIGSSDLASSTYKLYVNGKSYLAGDSTVIGNISIVSNNAFIKFNATNSLVQTTATTSNATHLIQWYKGTDRDPNYTYAAQIGWHNTGDDGNGGIYLIPTPQNEAPWNGTTGLYIGKTTLSYKGNSIYHAGNLDPDKFFQYRNQVVNNTDFNTLNLNGIYFNTTGNGTGNSNQFGGYGYLLRFYTERNDYGGVQIGVNSDSSYVAFRSHWDNKWKDWVQLASTSYVSSNYLPLTGGTLTNGLNFKLGTQTGLIYARYNGADYSNVLWHKHGDSSGVGSTVIFGSPHWENVILETKAGITGAYRQTSGVKYKIWDEGNLDPGLYYKLQGQMGTSSGNWDWNSYTTFGTYKVQTGNSITNHPTVFGTTTQVYAYGLAMIIRGMGTDSENRILQMYFPHNYSVSAYKNIPLYMRMYNGSSWNSWIAMASAKYVSDNYLALSGGTINSTDLVPLVVNTTAASNTFRLSINGTSKATVGWDSTNGAYLYESTSSKYIGVKSDGTPYYNNGTSAKTLWHEGNFTPGSSDKLNSASLKSTKGLHYYYAGGITQSTDNTGEYSGPLAGTKYVSILRLQSHDTAGGLYYRDLIFDVNSDYIWSRRITNSGTPVTKTLAYTTDNVASATKLQTSRTLWGQSFDGSGNVSGNMTGLGSIIGFNSIRNSSDTSQTNGIWVGNTFTSSLVNTDLAYNATKHIFYTGNVGIGTASPTTKLEVNGTVKATAFNGTASNASKIENVSLIDIPKSTWIEIGKNGSSEGSTVWNYIGDLTTGTGDDKQNDALIEFEINGDQNYVYARKGHLHINSYGASSRSLVLHSVGNLCDVYATLVPVSSTASGTCKLYLGVAGSYTGTARYRILRKGSKVTLYTSNITNTKTAPSSTYVKNNGTFRSLFSNSAWTHTVANPANSNLNADLIDGYHISVTSSPGTNSSTIYFVT